jgi:aminopeptidase N
MILRIILVGLLASLHFFACAQRDIDVMHYKFEVVLTDSSDLLRARATITIKALKNISSFDVDLKNVKEGKGMIVSSVRDEISELAFKHENDKVSISLPVMLKSGDEKNIIISYTGIPADGLIISKNKYGHRTFFADNWPNRGHNWLPCNDDPADKASTDFIITAPQHYQVVANGIQIEETDLAGDKKLTHWKEKVPISTKVMVIGVAEFAVSLSGIIEGRIPVYSWVYPEDRDKGFYDYALAADILPWFINRVGSYPYQKLANVQSKTTFGGLENANTIFYSENSVNGTRKSESLLAHEIAHQWFGNMATEKTFAHLWLSEGFATYMTVLYMENKYGTDTARKMILEDRAQVIDFAKASNRPVVDHTDDFMDLLNPNSYQKGGWILHMLRKQLGDSIFWKSIRQYYLTYAGKTADTDDLRKIFEKTSGQDLQQFFKQWLYTPGIPVLNINWKYNASEKQLSITVSQVQKQGPYQFPLEIAIHTSNSKPRMEKLMITKPSETFSYSLKDKPLKLEADPNVSLLFEGNIKEIN